MPRHKESTWRTCYFRLPTVQKTGVISLSFMTRWQVWRVYEVIKLSVHVRQTVLNGQLHELTVLICTPLSLEPILFFTSPTELEFQPRAVRVALIVPRCTHEAGKTRATATVWLLRHNQNPDLYTYIYIYIHPRVSYRIAFAISVRIFRQGEKKSIPCNAG